MQKFCVDCLSKDVCDITGASCKKMDALVNQRKLLNNGRTTIMSNTPKNVTPKTVADKTAESQTGEEKTVPAQAAEPKAEKKESISVDDIKVDVKEKKHSVVQRIKASFEGFKVNKKALAIVGATVVIAGLAVKNRRKAVAVEWLDPTDTEVNGVVDDENPDSL